MSAYLFVANENILTNVGASRSSRFFLPLSKSSRHKSRSNCDAARCSDGNKLGLHVISSRKAIVCERSPSSCSKSWKCFDTQCLQNLKFNEKFSKDKGKCKPQDIENPHCCWRAHHRFLSIPGRFNFWWFISRI